MTKKELSQLYYLNREIERLQKQIKEFECVATGCTTNLTGMPHGSGTSNKVGDYAAEIADLKGILNANVQKCFYEFNRLNRYINTVDDSEIRMILSFRYINGLCWSQVAASIGEGYTADSVRMKCSRFLERN